MADNTHKADVSFIKALAELLRENDLTELRVKREYSEADSLDVRVSRGQLMSPAASAPATQLAAPAEGANARSPGAAPHMDDDPASQPGAVTSPMVGTVYMAPEPDAPNFVSTGDTVQEGQTLLIVEAMKTMNHIPAPRSGKIKRILIEDGAPVEFGAPLMIIE